MDFSFSRVQFTPQVLLQMRLRKRETQEIFWRRFGVTQSSGSRFEAGDPLPATLVILMRLYTNGTLTDDILARHRTAMEASQPVVRSRTDEFKLHDHDE